MFRLDDNRVIDATLCGGLARYVNHSCDPNCVTECVQIDRESKILIIANRRIQRGEEVSDSRVIFQKLTPLISLYSLLMITNLMWKMTNTRFPVFVAPPIVESG